MKTNIIEYKIVVEEDLVYFEKMVNYYLTQGWCLYGKLQIKKNRGFRHSNRNYFYQTMVKFEKQ